MEAIMLSAQRMATVAEIWMNFEFSCFEAVGVLTIDDRSCAQSARTARVAKVEQRRWRFLWLTATVAYNNAFPVEETQWNA
jgi:hypothetical protein